MSERDGYQPGVPCWVDTWQPDAEAAVAFYTQLFGGEAEDTMPPTPGYEGGEPQQPVPRDVVGTMAPMSSAVFPDDVPGHWSVDFGSTMSTRPPTRSYSSEERPSSPRTTSRSLLSGRPSWPIRRAPLSP